MPCADPPIPRHLLPAVARTFALTLRLLPRAVRPSLELAYLLARFSDTQADGPANPAEAGLLTCGDGLLAALEASPDRAAIEQVWATIRDGQAFDKTRFQPGGSPLTPDELDRYTYMVAGCVGEFWTDLCAARLPGFAKVPPCDLRIPGMRMGKGLQLVNILRDRHKDALLGRIYLPDDGIPAAINSARAHLAAGAFYVQSLRRGRLRAACALPLLLARETLDLVEADPEAPNAKLSRRRVRTLLLRALFF